MYSTKTENFTVRGNIDISVLREDSEGNTHYALIKVSLLGKNTYGICALGCGHAFEIIGEDVESAQRLYSNVLCAAPSPCHMFDVVCDFRREQNFEFES